MGDRVVWTRVVGVDGRPLDLVKAQIRQRHYAPHVHDEYAIGACTAGVEVIRYRGELHYAGPDAVLILEPGEPHTGGPAVPTGFAYRALYPSVSVVSEGSLGQPHFRDPVVHDAELAEGLRRVHSALSGRVEPLEAESGLSWLLAALVRRHASPASSVALAGDVRRTGKVAGRVMMRLADQMTSPPTLAEIAGDLGLSRYQVLRAFRNEVGMPPYAWLAQHRVARARRLLEAGQRPAEVAALVGFADQAHLTRWFRRVLGVTPRAYRNSVQDGVLRRP